ncbi:hypothetical protein [Rhizomonospora bruguierae]|nr:hypothetical protein [Micromonospora sp. NBRC 107566]
MKSVDVLLWTVAAMCAIAALVVAFRDNAGAATGSAPPRWSSP